MQLLADHCFLKTAANLACFLGSAIASPPMPGCSPRRRAKVNEGQQYHHRDFNIQSMSAKIDLLASLYSPAKNTPRVQVEELAQPEGGRSSHCLGSNPSQPSPPAVSTSWCNTSQNLDMLVELTIKPRISQNLDMLVELTIKPHGCSGAKTPSPGPFAFAEVPAPPSSATKPATSSCC